MLCFVAIVVAAIGLSSRGTEEDERIATEGRRNDVPANPGSNEAEPTLPPTTVPPPDVSWHIPGLGWEPSPTPIFNIQSLPPGWREVYPPGYPLLEGRDALTLATVLPDTPPAPTCDYPMNLLDALGPSDAMVSILEDPTSAYVTARPPAGELILPEFPETADEICYENAGPLGEPLEFSVRFTAIGFLENGRTIRLHVALGAGASDQREQEVREIIGSLTVAPAE